VRVGRVDPAALDKAECDVAIGTLVGYIDPIAGVRILRRARGGFARAGAVERVVWCDCLFAFFAEIGSGATSTPWRVRRHRERAERLCAEHGLDAPRLEVMRAFLDGMATFRRGDWEATAALWERALADAEATGLRGGFEHAYLSVQAGFVHMVRQRPRQVVPCIEAGLANVRDNGEVATLAYVHAGRALLALWSGDLEGARGFYEAATASLPRERFTIQRAVTWILRLQLGVYDGERTAREALARGELANAERHGLLDGVTGGFYASLVALSHATALRAGDASADAALVQRLARRSVGRPPCGAGDAERAMAYLEDARGRPTEALAWLERAERAAVAHDRAIATAIARFQRGLRIGGDEGAALVAAGEQAIAELGASSILLREDPARR
jgi:hypothetical protein